jgi:hypothetical protein
MLNSTNSHTPPSKDPIQIKAAKQRFAMALAIQ